MGKIINVRFKADYVGLGKNYSYDNPIPGGWGRKKTSKNIQESYTVNC
jgi:hypothetical protein